MPVFHFGYHTETLGTAITEIIPGVPGMIPRITAVTFKSAGTAHNVRLLRCVAATTAASNAASGQLVIEFTDTGAMNDPSNGTDEPVAANDFVAYMTDGGIQELNSVASVSGNNVTMATNLAYPVDVNATIWIFGEIARATHITHVTEINVLNPRYDLTAQNGTPGQIDQYNARSGAGDAAIIHIDNLTAASAIKHVSGIYVDASDVTAT